MIETSMELKLEEKKGT